ncbi:SpoIIE family protein phosphatase [Streptomyces cinnabarinus]|uniref:SpoIIE family protein phosphatase n=1 Tax=Streptomyces cinnabarinus TaxID=67287 RepID=A0ABY7KSH9_9ACTN|nr:SpoIIE family protein phosphatase [Streptomyces cinnabarinus]WAZ25661.1 SpoIIE family protein phosphatase [Streptomyces cinnabarinus]
MSSTDHGSGARPFGTTNAERAAERDDALVDAVLRAVEVSGAHAASVFLVSADGSALVLAAAAGMPPSLLGGWRRIAVNSPIPVAEAFRVGRTVHLTDAEATVRRFPQLAIAVPYPFGSASVPVAAGRDVLGALAVVWAAQSGGQGLSKAQRRHLRTTAGRLGTALARLGAGDADAGSGTPQAPLEIPIPAASAVRVGLFDWDVSTGRLTADATACAIFGLKPDEFDGRAATLAAQVHPADRQAFRAAGRAAVRNGRVLARCVRIPETGGGHRTIELWGRVPTGHGRAGAASHVVGGVLDLGSGMAAAAALERLADGFFALDRDGRVTYANHRLVRLVHTRRGDLVGRRPWEALPWLADPAFEDRFRAAQVSQQPVSFLARGPHERLLFSLRPDTQGTTGWVTPAADPGPATAGARPGPDSAGGPAPTRPGALYRILEMSSALTEAVTALDVCRVVADQLLPAFGGHRLAAYVVREGRLYLLCQRGYHESFLDRFEGISLRQTWGPVTGSLAGGTPLFIETPEELARAYPELEAQSRSFGFLPLLASSRPVGALVLGFDEEHRFTGEERSVLTALSGLIAQALERARLYDAKNALAHGLQHALLPHELPNLPGVSVTGRYLPATAWMDIGGDWYDVIGTDHGIALVVGDVEGHNVAAAATMGQLRSAVRAFASADLRPSEVVAATNRLLIDLGPGPLASCCYILLDPATGIAHVVRAGHCPPLLHRPDGRTETVDPPGGPLLGIDRDADYPQAHLALSPGCLLALYTDGLVETRDADITTGIDRLRTRLAHADTDSLDKLADALLHSAKHAPNRTDDIALLLTEYTHAVGM